MRWGVTAWASSCVIVVVVLFGFPTGTSAQPDEPNVAEARQLFDEGMELYEREAFARAESVFRRVYQLLEGHPRRPSVLVNIARCVEGQPGREGEALAMYERMIADTNATAATDPSTRQARQIAEERIAELRARGVTPRAQEGGGGISPIGPVLLAVGGAAVIVGAITGSLALTHRADAESLCQGTRCLPDVESRASEIAALAMATDVLLFAGAAIAVTGLVLTFVLQEGGAEARASAGCGPTGCMALLEGRLE